jgi:hypothetical protein
VVVARRFGNPAHPPQSVTTVTAPGTAVTLVTRVVTVGLDFSHSFEMTREEYPWRAVTLMTRVVTVGLDFSRTFEMTGKERL